MPSFRITDLLTALTLFAVGCAPDASATGSDSQDVTAETAYEYACTTSDPLVLDSDSIHIAIGDNRARITDGYGPVYGDLQSSGSASTRSYRGFEHGGDCALSITATDDALTGASETKVIVQCESAEGLDEDVYSCKDPKKVSLSGAAKPTKPVRPDPMPKGTPTWTCAGADEHELGRDVTMQLTRDAMRLTASELQYDGVRNESYKSRTPGLVEYRGFEYGGDCALSAVIDESALGDATAAELRIRCRGKRFQEDVLRCTRD